MSEHGSNDRVEPKLVDSSAPLFSMYNKKAKEHDEKMTEGWKGDADGILIFTGLFSAVVSVLLGSSLQNLQLNPQNASSFYLGHIYQLTPGLNVSSIPFDDPATFKPPKSAILVSTLWSFSLVTSLTCALLATLLQQWSRRYMHITLNSDDPQERAQTRELMWRALERRASPRWMVEFLPFLLHTSVFLFLVGFVVYLFAFDSLVAKLVAASAGIGFILYLYISFLPIFFWDSPYSTPLTTLFWFITTGLISLFIYLHYSALRRRCAEDEDLECKSKHSQRLRDLRESYEDYDQRRREDITYGVKKLSNKKPSDLATYVLSSTVNFLDGISDLEQFLSYVPGFYDSHSVKDHFQDNDDLHFHRLPSHISHFMKHVVSSKQIEQAKKEEHITMCSKAMDAHPSILENTFWLTLQDLDSKVFEYPVFIEPALEQLRTADESGTANANQWMESYAQCVMAIAISRAPLTDPWINIARRYLNVMDADDAKVCFPDAQDHFRDAQGHLLNGLNLQNINNLRLCNLRYLTKHLKDDRLKSSDQFAKGKLWHQVLEKVAKNVDVTGIAPELQQKFCTLWQELGTLVGEGQQGKNATSVRELLNTVNTQLCKPPNTTVRNT